MTEGEFPIQQTPLPEPTQEPPVPDADGDSDDSDVTVDYREDSLLALAAGDQDVLIRLPTNFRVDPSLVPLDGDGFASWLTKQDKVKAGTVTPAMQQKYAKEIRAAKLEEFKSYLDNDAIRLTDRRKLGRDVNFLTGRWVLTVKVDKNGFFSKFKARWVCRGFQDKFAWDQRKYAKEIRAAKLEEFKSYLDNDRGDGGIVSIVGLERLTDRRKLGLCKSG